MIIRDVTIEDAPALTEIYNFYIANTLITFEEDVIGVAQMIDRIRDKLAHGFPWIVAHDTDENIIGYAYAGTWRERIAYRRTIETTVYLSQQHLRRGHGSALYRAILERATASGFHVGIGVITVPNDASIGLHKKMGFEKVGKFKQVGFKFGNWADVEFWQKVLD